MSESGSPWPKFGPAIVREPHLDQNLDTRLLSRRFPSLPRHSIEQSTSTMRRRILSIISLGYAALVCWRLIVVLHRDKSPFDHSVSVSSNPLSVVEAERLREAKRNAVELFLIALPWALVVLAVNPSVAGYILALLLNVATVFVLSAWLLGLIRRRPK